MQNSTTETVTMKEFKSWTLTEQISRFYSQEDRQRARYKITMIDLTAEEEEPVIEINEVFSRSLNSTQKPIVIEDDYPECIDVESVNDVEIVEESCRPPSEYNFLRRQKWELKQSKNLSAAPFVEVKNLEKLKQK